MNIADFIPGAYGESTDFDVLPLLELDKVFFEALVDDITGLVGRTDSADVTDPAHGTYWTNPKGTVRQWSLWNESGDFNDKSYDSPNSGFHHSEDYPTLAKLIEWATPCTSFRLNALGSNSSLSAHKETVILPGPNGPVMKARFHLPIVTNKDALVMVNGVWFHLPTTTPTVWFFQNGGIHSASNRHQTDWRFHLVWDVLVNEASWEKYFARQRQQQEWLQPATNALLIAQRESVSAYADCPREADQVARVDAEKIKVHP